MANVISRRIPITLAVISRPGLIFEGRWLLGLVLRGPMAVVGLALSAMYVVFAVQALGLIWPTVNTEGNQLTGIMRVRAGEALYQDFQQFPYHVVQYPPIMYLLSGGLSRALDLSVFQTMVAARGITLVATLASIGLLYALARAIGSSRTAALAGAGLLLSIPFLDPWGFTIRCDMLAVAITLLATLLLVRMPDRPWASAAVAALALFAKQTMVAFPIAAIVWLWWSPPNADRRAAGWFAAVWGGFVLAGLGVMQLATDGYYALNVYIAHLNPTNGLDTALGMFLQFPQEAWLPIGLAAVAVGNQIASRRPHLLAWYWVAAMGLALFTLRGRGADANYFIEPAAVACVLAAQALDGLWRRLERGAPLHILGAAGLAGLALLWGWFGWQDWRAGDRTSLDRRLPLEDVANAEHVLAEEPLMVLLAGKPVVLSDPFHVSQMTSAGRFDPTELAGLVKRRDFDLVVVRGDVRQPRSLNGQLKWPEAVLRAVREDYVSAGTRGPYWLYVPDRPRSPRSS